MPRRWTNADQYTGADARATERLHTELRAEWSYRAQRNTARTFRNTHSGSYFPARLHPQEAL